MALFSVRSAVKDAKVAASAPNHGMALTIVSDTSTLAERADQSTWPAVAVGEDGRVGASTGPHNVIRRVVEFALEHPEVEVFLGTPTEIVATMHSLARKELDSARMLFCDDPDQLAVWQRPAVCADAAELVTVCGSIGVPVSERTAHRVLAFETSALESVLSIVAPRPEPTEPSVPDIYRDRRGLKIHHTDLAAFTRRLEDAFDSLGERYYVHLKGEPKVKVGRDSITVRFEVDKED